MSDITIFRAKKILTMDVNLPDATHVAVRDGLILAVGDKDCANQWGEVTFNDQLAEHIMMPGFVEGHAHMMAGAIWQYSYVGYHDRLDPDGKLWRGATTLDAVISRLQLSMAENVGDKSIVGWGFDPIFLTTERLSRHHLDQVSHDRPIVIIFSNFHLMCVNSAALALVNYTRDTEAEGIVKDAEGEPTGELQEMAAMFPIMRRVGIDFSQLSHTEYAISRYADVAKRAGVTTVTDLYSSMEDADLELMLKMTSPQDFPLRIVPALAAMSAKPEEVAERVLAYKARSTNKLRLGAIKLMTDGSIQGWTARVKPPGYIGGQANGIWNIPPEQIMQTVECMHKNHLQMHIHVNGDEASDVVIEACASAMQKHSWPDHRHVLQHAQMMGIDQLKRCHELGLCVNMFANHLWYFGDQHAALTIGDDRARRMDALRSALDQGLITAMHSDAPVTPMGPLFTAWCAVNRQTMSGRTLGNAQRIRVDEALFAITMQAARTLKLDQEIGSIEVGKRADFTLLSEDPTDVEPMMLKDIEVMGTVMDGHVFPR